MVFKYKILHRLTREILVETNNFEVAQKIVLSQDRGNSNKKLLILREKV